MIPVYQAAWKQTDIPANLFDYINGITIGNIAAEMATSLEDDFLNPLLAMGLYTGTALFISYLSGKSVKYRVFCPAPLA